MFCCEIASLILVVVGVLLVALSAAVYFQLPKRLKCSLHGKHVFITGGSKGIGKAVAVEALRRGARCVTIVARNAASLKAATDELEGLCGSDQIVKSYELDVSKSYGEVERVIRGAEADNGDIDVLINNAGVVVQGAFDEIAIGDFENQMRTNYLSMVFATRAVVEKMKTRRSGHISFVSSIAGQSALWGYTAYSSTKFAIRGFADALYMEMLQYNVGVSILYPPNTETEGFQIEKQTMPDEVREITHSAGVFSAEQVAKAYVKNIEIGRFSTTIGLEGWVVGVLTAGASQEPDFGEAVFQILFAGIFRGIILFTLGNFNAICRRCHLKKNKTAAEKVKTQEQKQQ